MRNQSIAIAIVLATVLVFSAGPGSAEDGRAPDQTALMEALVDQYIASCEAKFGLSQSRSAELRRAAAFYSLKGAYCTLYRDDLVEALVEAKVETKPYKVGHFLNQRFYETIYSRTHVAQK